MPNIHKYLELKNHWFVLWRCFNILMIVFFSRNTNKYKYKYKFWNTNKPLELRQQMSLYEHIHSNTMQTHIWREETTHLMKQSTVKLYWSNPKSHLSDQSHLETVLSWDMSIFQIIGSVFILNLNCW